jgi:hypothetical protein
MSANAWYARILSSAGGSLDHFYSQFVHSLGTGKFFVNGWGDVSKLDFLKFSRLAHSVQVNPGLLPIRWEIMQTGIHKATPFQLAEGTFISPSVTVDVFNVPRTCNIGRVWLLRPTNKAYGDAGMSACVIQLPATGEHTAAYDYIYFTP